MKCFIQFNSLLVISLLTACTAPPVAEFPPESPQPEPVQQPAAETVSKRELSVVAVGDIMLGTDFPSDRLPPQNGELLLAQVAGILASADISLGNYEGTFIDGGIPAKTCRDMSRCYLFRTPPHYAQNLARAGFDLISLANNHARDFGEHGRSSSMDTLARHNIQHSGAKGDVASLTLDGLRIAMIAFAPFRGSNNPLALQEAGLLVSALAEEHDIVLVSMHMGAEGEDATRIPFADEIYHGELRGNVVAFSHTVVDAGADLVIGHGPHVPRALELYKGRLIAYSLGNFCTYYGINVRGLNGLAPILRAQLDANGAFVQGEIISTRQQRPNGPSPDPSHEAARLMAQLTRQDFPSTPLEISETGLISIKTGD
jgi:poly-gamma-glutamate capsule biosynthesis protein CapA/YwtB (metallophosphatase superfamily)